MPDAEKTGSREYKIIMTMWDAVLDNVDEFMIYCIMLPLILRDLHRVEMFGTDDDLEDGSNEPRTTIDKWIDYVQIGYKIVIGHLLALLGSLALLGYIRSNLAHGYIAAALVNGILALTTTVWILAFGQWELKFYVRFSPRRVVPFRVPHVSFR